jgi:hypothetical protein
MPAMKFPDFPWFFGLNPALEEAAFSEAQASGKVSQSSRLHHGKHCSCSHGKIYPS